MNGGRPLGLRKTVQLMVILTILAWATQTLLSQWGYGATPAEAKETTQAKESFVPPADASYHAAVDPPSPTPVPTPRPAPTPEDRSGALEPDRTAIRRSNATIVGPRGRVKQLGMS